MNSISRQDKRKIGLEMLAANASPWEITQALSITERTVNNWTRRKSPEHQSHKLYKGRRHMGARQIERLKDFMCCSEHRSLVKRRIRCRRAWPPKAVLELIKLKFRNSAEARMTAESISTFCKDVGLIWDRDLGWIPPDFRERYR
jgi:hypothetical protein